MSYNPVVNAFFAEIDKLVNLPLVKSRMILFAKIHKTIIFCILASCYNESETNELKSDGS
jgi:hypothetical protein